MTRPVRLLFFTQTLDCETCLQTRQILDELPALSDKICDRGSELRPRVARRPHNTASTACRLLRSSVRTTAGAERDSNIRFLGTPAGYEFISLIHAVRLAGGGGVASLRGGPCPRRGGRPADDACMCSRRRPVRIVRGP